MTVAHCVSKPLARFGSQEPVTLRQVKHCAAPASLRLASRGLAGVGDGGACFCTHPTAIRAPCWRRGRVSQELELVVALQRGHSRQARRARRADGLGSLRATVMVETVVASTGPRHGASGRSRSFARLPCEPARARLARFTATAATAYSLQPTAYRPGTVQLADSCLVAWRPGEKREKKELGPTTRRCRCFYVSTFSTHEASSQSSIPTTISLVRSCSP
jgi:hypothetical protein